ncbi:putative bifunctional diguanylate cyclase/phosphodiesterase [Orrella sp. 11846]|uniref:putative bifunctional diguanylate cyclase/phosphodiesterase n=1 Tax=Orrella sp. 11846 TaxID=3409913 RepID=UPI003B5A6B2A
MFKTLSSLAQTPVRVLDTKKYIRLYLIVSMTAVFWVGVAGWVGIWRLTSPDPVSYVFMAPAVASLLILSAVLLAISFYLLDTASIEHPMTAGRRRFAKLLALLALLAILVANYGEHWALWWQGDRDGFLLTASVLLAIGSLIILFLDTKFFSDQSKPIDRRVILWCVIGSLVSVGGAYTLIERDIDQVNRYVQARAEMVTEALQLSFIQPVSAMQRMSDRWDSLDHAPAPQYVRQEIRSYLRDFTEITRISLLTESGEFQGDVHGDTRTDGLLEEALTLPGFHAILKTTRQLNTAQMTTPGLLKTHPDVAFVLAPFEVVDGGFVVATIDMGGLVRQSFTEDEPPCCFNVRTALGQFFATPGPVNENQAIAVAYDRGQLEDMFNFEVAFWKEKMPGEIGMADYPIWILLIGLVFTFVAALSQRMAQLAQERAVELFENARHDALTDLPNRRLFQEVLQSWNRTDYSQRGLSLMFVEIRGVRLINDSLGYEMGDALIRAASVRLREFIPPFAWLARLDGAEFVVCLPRMTQQELTDLAYDLLEQMDAPLSVKGRHLSIKTLIGVSSSTDEEITDPMALVHQADLAMLEAKRKATTQFAYYNDEMGRAAALRIALAQDLGQAIKDGDLNMVYQPLVDSRTGLIVAMESLVRWRHAVHGFISPAVFIPMAEESGQILSLTQWTLEQACTEATEMGLPTFDRVVPFAVNISPMFFQREDFLTVITSTLERAQIEPKYLQIEVTEGLMMQDRDTTIKKLHALAAMGIRSALDDFGTGYSSLSYLRDLPVHKVKLDRSFVIHVTENDVDANIVEGVIGIVRDLEMTVVVEGVETSEQAALLARFGCDQFQGYLFSKPLDCHGLREILHHPRDFLSLIQNNSSI